LLPGYGAKRLPDGQRDDGLSRNGRLIARRERIFFEKVAQKFLLDNNDLLAPKAPYLKADFAEGEILPQQFPARELRAHLPRGSSLVLDVLIFSIDMENRIIF